MNQFFITVYCAFPSIFVEQTVDNVVNIFCTLVIILAEGVFMHKKVKNDDNNANECKSNDRSIMPVEILSVSFCA